MCDYEGCDNLATHRDAMENDVCVDCIEREIEDGAADSEDFERIIDIGRGNY